MGTVVLVSGGMDSATLLWYAEAAYSAAGVHAVSFDYGQRHAVELDSARKLVEYAGIGHTILDARSFIGPILARANSALTNDAVAVPHGHYEEESMKDTVVPYRNALFLLAAMTAAEVSGGDVVMTAVHAGDHAIYPDCRPEFVDAFVAVAEASNPGGPRLVAPFLHMRKEHIAGLGAVLGVPFEDTWSCYEGGELHCGLCGTCTERREAFRLAGVSDPTQYSEMW